MDIVLYSRLQYQTRNRDIENFNMAGHSTGFQIPPSSKKFQEWPQFQGFMKPCRFEGEVQNLEVIGTIPEEIHGTFYRVMPDPALPPYIDNDAVSG